jgi:pimeloyl-ACP methyl ester carboxylesterase
MNTAEIAARRGAKSVRANGIDIAYTEVGDGPPLVLLHGAIATTGPKWAGSTVAHVDHLPALGTHFRVIAPDTRGSGATVHPGGPAGFDVLADDVIGLIDALHLDRPLIAGFSEGGATATMVALRRPGAVRALVNHAGFDYFDPSAPIADGVRHMFGGGPEATRADPDAAERAFGAIPPMAATFATMKADYDDAQGEGHWRTYLGQFFDRHVAPLGATFDDFPAITVPTLMLTGDRDMFCSVEAACAAYRALPAGELGIVAATGHDITSGIVDAMEAFLRRHATEPRPFGAGTR